MKKAVNLLLVAVLIFSLMGCSKKGSDSAPKNVQSVESITWYGLEEGLKLAAEQDKLVLVDNYADWCGWCKRMDADVFSDAEVAKSLAERFIAVKLDVESPDPVTYKGNKYLPKQLSGQVFGVRGLPTFSILDRNGDPLGQLVGYSPKADFLKKLDVYQK